MTTSAKEAAQAIRDAKGFVTIAARRLNITREHLYTLIKRHPTVKEALTDAREEMKDFSEGKLFSNINEGKEASIFFHLKYQARDRGYGVERQEIEHGGQITIKVVYDDIDGSPSETTPETTGIHTLQGQA